MRKKQEISEACPESGDIFELRLGKKTRRCKLVFASGPKVQDGDVAEALARLKQALDRHGSTPENGELEAFARQYSATEKAVGVALSDGPVMFRCAQKGRLVSHYIDDELEKVSLWLVVCQGEQWTVTRAG